MALLRNMILSLSAMTLTGGFYLKKQKVSLKNQYLRSILSFLHNKNEKCSSWLLKEMIYFSMISHCQELEKYVFSYGFDFDAFFIDGLNEIGFDTLQFGPISLMPSIKQQNRMHFGNKITLGNINVFCQKRNQIQNNQNQEKQQKHSKLGIAISPNYEVVKYAPYLIEENVISCLKQCQLLNQTSKNLSVNRYVIKLNDPEMIEMKSPQYIAMVQQIIKNAYQTIQGTLQKNKIQFAQSIETLKKPQIFIQVPNLQQNPQIFKTVKQMPNVQKLIIDGSQYEVTRSIQKVNKKTVNNIIKLTVSKKRMTFQQLLNKVVDNTL